MKYFLFAFSNLFLKIKSTFNYTVSIILPLNSIVQSVAFGRRLLMETYNTCLVFYNENKLVIWFISIILSVAFSSYRLFYFLLLLELKKIFNSLFEKKSQIYLADKATIAQHWARDWDLRVIKVILNVFSILGLFVLSIKFFLLILISVFEVESDCFVIFLNFNPVYGLYLILIASFLEFFSTCHIIVYRNDPIKEAVPMLASAGWKVGKNAALALFSFFGGVTLSQNEAVTDGLKKINENVPSIGTNMVHRTVHGVEHSNPCDHELYLSMRKNYPEVNMKDITSNKQFDFGKIETKFISDEEFARKVLISDYHKMGLGKYLNHKAVEDWNANKISQFGEGGAKARNYIVTLPNKKVP